MFCGCVTSGHIKAHLFYPGITKGNYAAYARIVERNGESFQKNV